MLGEKKNTIYIYIYMLNNILLVNRSFINAGFLKVNLQLFLLSSLLMTYLFLLSLRTKILHRVLCDSVYYETEFIIDRKSRFKARNRSLCYFTGYLYFRKQTRNNHEDLITNMRNISCLSKYFKMGNVFT